MVKDMLLCRTIGQNVQSDGIIFALTQRPSYQTMRLRTLALITLAAIPGCSHPEQSSGPSPYMQAGSLKPQALFRTADGWGICGDFTPRQGAQKAVLLLHQRGGRAYDWQPLIPKLQAEGFAVLAIDQRGAGRSQGPQNGPDAPWDTQQDIAGAIGFLGQKGFPANKVAIAGASYGANNALLYAAAHKDVPAVALLSPGKNYHGLDIQGQTKTVKGSVLVMTAKDDSITEGGPQVIKQDAPGVELQEYNGEAHGTHLFSAIPETADKLVAFFKRSM